MVLGQSILPGTDGLGHSLDLKHLLGRRGRDVQVLVGHVVVDHRGDPLVRRRSAGQLMAGTTDANCVTLCRHVRLLARGLHVHTLASSRNR